MQRSAFFACLPSTSLGTGSLRCCSTSLLLWTSPSLQQWRSSRHSWVCWTSTGGFCRPLPTSSSAHRLSEWRQEGRRQAGVVHSHAASFPGLQEGADGCHLPGAPTTWSCPQSGCWCFGDACRSRAAPAPPGVRGLGAVGFLFQEAGASSDQILGFQQGAPRLREQHPLHAGRAAVCPADLATSRSLLPLGGFRSLGELGRPDISPTFLSTPLISSTYQALAIW